MTEYCEFDKTKWRWGKKSISVRSKLQELLQTHRDVVQFSTNPPNSGTRHPDVFEEKSRAALAAYHHN